MHVSGSPMDESLGNTSLRSLLSADLAPLSAGSDPLFGALSIINNSFYPILPDHLLLKP